MCNMITEIEFKRLINTSESSILDFKTKMYDFSNDKDSKKTSKFVKDIISFSNTIRNTNSYIIIGIEELQDGKKKLHGIDNIVDDAILQDKIKNKVFPLPKFNFYTLEYDSKTYGIIEFPIIKYSTPIIPAINMKGIEKGKIYYRQGTSNSEAGGLETINITDWLRSLPDIIIDKNVSNEISKLLAKVTEGEEKLSVIITEILTVSRKYNLTDLIEFCTNELQGISEIKIKETSNKYKYRHQEVIASLNEIKVKPYYNGSVNDVKKALEDRDDFYEFQLFYNKSIVEIEEYIQTLNDKNAYATLKRDFSDIFPESNIIDCPVIVYLFEDTFTSLYSSIKQKVIDTLLTV